MRIPAIPGAVLVVMFGLVAFSASSVAETKSVAEGKRLVQPCARCHVIVANGPSSWTDAPPFEAIANRPGIQRAGLANFMQQQHMHMLTDTYTNAQANSIASYILGLRKK